VSGDIVQLEAGDKVPADLRLISASSLSIEEAILTGESVPTRKQLDPVEEAAVLGDRRSMAYSGTMVTRGTATGVVVGTGARTEIGRISGLLANVEQLTTPLIQQMGVFARYLTGVILAVSALILLWGTMLRGQDFAETFMIVVGLTVAAIPEGLPAVLTVTLAIGVQTMARRNAIVRRLPTIETLGAVSVICSDKTGTLTRNEMMVATLLTAEGDTMSPARATSRRAQLPAKGRAPTRKRHPRSPISRGSPRSATRRPARGRAMAGGRGRPDGRRAAGAGRQARLRSRGPGGAADSIPFDAEYRYMATLHRPEGDMTVALVKGAPERILDMCDSELADGGPRPLDARTLAAPCRGDRQ
jgi:magnesium-transporting ATPase (P-type)